jgi:fumarate reductase subunit C
MNKRAIGRGGLFNFLWDWWHSPWESKKRAMFAEGNAMFTIYFMVLALIGVAWLLSKGCAQVGQ